MKKFLVVLIALLSFSNSFSQIEPVKWTIETEKLSDTEYNLIYKAKIDDHWHLYSQHLPEEGAIPTEFLYDSIQKTKYFKLIGEAKESESITKYDKVFEMDLTYFDHEATFTQKIEVLDPKLKQIESEISFQACDDEKCIFESEVVIFDLNVPKKDSKVFEPVKWSIKTEKLSDTEYNLIYKAKLDNHWHLYSQYLPEEGAIPTEFFYDSIQSTKKFKLIGKAKESKSITEYDKVFEMDLTYFDDEATFTQKIKVLDPKLKQIESEISFQACDDEKCIFESELVTFNLNKTASASLKTVDARSIALSEKLDLNVTGWDKYQTEEVKEKSNFNIFILGFFGGLIALLTPCVFPMIPLTVSFFTKSAGNNSKGVRDSILYGFFIFLIYVILSLPFHLLDSLDPEILNNISTNVTLNIIFFVIFIAFAISFFGYFELTLPQSWSNALDTKANKIGGWIGVFFMALTLAIVSFSCTGPILGTLLGSSLSSDGGATQLTMGMSGFGLALALPFTLFAMFPKWLNSLPKSGGWLNTVKVVLGFLELALALKFLSNADLVEHWGLLKREIFIGLWIIIGLALFLYLIGKIKFPHDGPLKKISFSRWSFAFLVLAFVIYLIPGLQKNPIWELNALSGFPPPAPYSIYERDSECPLGLNCYKDLAEGVAAAKEQGKPIMLDFTGWACVNCRKMEEQVWSKDKVYKILSENYIIVSLYVDDRKELSKDAQFQYLKPNGNIKNIKTIGDKWATLQTINFQNNSQPYYVLLSQDMELLNHPAAYVPNVDVYSTWLKAGLENFENDSH